MKFCPSVKNMNVSNQCIFSTILNMLGGETITLMVFHIVTLMCPLRAIVPRLVHEVLIVWLANLMSYTLSEYVVPLTEGVVGLVSLPFET